jgi:uncharacterized membrane protein
MNGRAFNRHSRRDALVAATNSLLGIKNMIMQTMICGAMAALIAVSGIAAPLAAKTSKSQPVRYEYNGRTYNSYQQCRAQKNKATKDGTIVGAAVAGVGAAILGANLGETALIAGGGALVGNQLGKTKKC